MTAMKAPFCSYLGEPNVLGVLPKALTADVQVVLADDTPLVATYSAAERKSRVRQIFSVDHTQRLVRVQLKVLSLDA